MPMICQAEMEFGNSVDIEISMAEQFDVHDDDEDLRHLLGIANIDQLIMPTSTTGPT